VIEKQWEGAQKEPTPTGLYNDGHNWPMHMPHHSGTEKAPFNAVNVSFGTKRLIIMQACVQIPIHTIMLLCASLLFSQQQKSGNYSFLRLKLK